MEPEENGSANDCNIPVAAEQADVSFFLCVKYSCCITAMYTSQPLLCGVKMSEIREIADSRLHSRVHSRALSRRASSFFNIPSPSHEELADESFRGKCTRVIHSFKFQVS